jgi:hypothetical protein
MKRVCEVLETTNERLARNELYYTCRYTLKFRMYEDLFIYMGPVQPPVTLSRPVPELSRCRFRLIPIFDDDCRCHQLVSDQSVRLSDFFCRGISSQSANFAMKLLAQRRNVRISHARGTTLINEDQFISGFFAISHPRNKFPA